MPCENQVFMFECGTAVTVDVCPNHPKCLPPPIYWPLHIGFISILNTPFWTLNTEYRILTSEHRMLNTALNFRSPAAQMHCGHLHFRAWGTQYTTLCLEYEAILLAKLWSNQWMNTFQWLTLRWRGTKLKFWLLLERLSWPSHISSKNYQKDANFLI